MSTPEALEAFTVVGTWVSAPTKLMIKSTLESWSCVEELRVLRIRLQKQGGYFHQLTTFDEIVQTLRRQQIRLISNDLRSPPLES
jgi:hypothetical protein